MAFLSSLIGFLYLLLRFAPILRSAWVSPSSSRSSYQSFGAASDAELVSIIVPARNEEANLPNLLESLVRMNRSNFEVVLVDDESEDRTREIAERFAHEHPWLPLKIVSGRPRPPRWSGKNWACHQGYLQSSGRYLLFTDADTQHLPGSLETVVAKMHRHGLDLLSAVPRHRCETWWEKLTGPFQIFLLLSTAAFSKPRPGRLFAIGQYLLFRRESYERQGGHEAIRGSLCDDLELARRCLESGGNYRVEGQTPLFRVRMYSSFKEFLNGWRRNFRLGFRHASLLGTMEIYFVIAALTANMKFLFASGVEISLMLAGALLLAKVQTRLGNFSVAGVLFLPANILLFVVVTFMALFDLLGQRDYSWRGRNYQGAVD